MLYEGVLQQMVSNAQRRAAERQRAALINQRQEYEEWSVTRAKLNGTITASTRILGSDFQGAGHTQCLTCGAWGVHRCEYCGNQIGMGA